MAAVFWAARSLMSTGWHSGIVNLGNHHFVWVILNPGERMEASQDGGTRIRQFEIRYIRRVQHTALLGGWHHRPDRRSSRSKLLQADPKDTLPLGRTSQTAMDGVSQYLTAPR